MHQMEQMRHAKMSEMMWCFSCVDAATQHTDGDRLQSQVLDVSCQCCAMQTVVCQNAQLKLIYALGQCS